jgi:LysM repeat protein
MKKILPGWVMTLVLMIFSLGIGLLLPRFNLDNFFQPNPTPTVETINQPTLTPSETLLPATPLLSPTPTNTLRPAPTFEPPTATPAPSNTPLPTATQAILVNVNIPGIRGAETATPTTTPGCVKNPNWRLTYEVQFNDTLTVIAQKFSTNIYALAEGNCLADADILRTGQVLLVPGDALPVQPRYVCEPIVLLQPVNSESNIVETVLMPNEGNIVFNWRGPRTPRNLIRVMQPSGKVWEKMVEVRQNETVDLYKEFKEAGWHEIWIVPLDENFVQVCQEYGGWRFFKEKVAATETPTPTPFPTSSGAGFGSP